MIKCVIVEDELTGQALLADKLKRLFPEITVKCIIDNKQEAVTYLNHNVVDIVFLDNRLKGGFGLDVIQQMEHPDFEVIFATAYSQYAVEALNKGAVFYLLKPFSDADFSEAVEKAIRKTNEKKNQLSIGVGTENIIKLDDIMYIESEGSYSVFTLLNKSTMMASKNLGYFENRLPTDTFFRIHHSFIVNIKHVIKVKNGPSPQLVLADGITCLPVSQRKAKAVFEQLKF
jgi:two-component system LytT family response regulator